MHIANRARICRAIAGGALLMLLSRPTVANDHVHEGAGLGKPVISASGGEDADEPRTIMVMGSGMFLLSRYLLSRMTKKPRFRTNRSAAAGKAEIASLA